jgi:LmbE family N-acetylglucosaminyl deacetylase
MGTDVDAMVIAPHPDDAEFGAGGTAARWVKEGKKVVLAVCTNGDKGTEDRTLSPEKLAGIREKEQRAAGQIVGFHDVVFLGYPDQGLEDSAEFRKSIVRLLRQYRHQLIDLDMEQGLVSRRPNRKPVPGTERRVGRPRKGEEIMGTVC